ncbi:hypothetical protein SAMN06265222_106333 [Neorhodopirellula lusitana]|uniref:Uncharacterized protein n=1 Tax=Neorhodopirellula lusitana TaxID=445327 RepID=A0ABY1Q7K4_9BACT|nr:hypothetical protein SAMN06265222_106333 [Neorhodopirellula lusitana]
MTIRGHRLLFFATINSGLFESNTITSSPPTRFERILQSQTFMQTDLRKAVEFLFTRICLNLSGSRLQNLEGGALLSGPLGIDFWEGSLGNPRQ